ncbi:MAG: KamA family radical SAM protein, partial [Euryarchaeota archaeon]|nr:KamA family radical SAM protein [Euryarchaeota archaeon]
MMKELMEYDKTKLIETLWECDPEIHNILISSDTLQDARNRLFDHLNDIERHLYNIYSDKYFKDLNLLEKNNAKECIRVFKNIIRTENETISNFSALQSLYSVGKGDIEPEDLTRGFLLEFIFLFKGINTNSGQYAEMDVPLFLKMIGMDAAKERMKSLDDYAMNMENGMRRYKTGLDKELIKERLDNKRFILDLFDAGEEEWQDYKWQLSNIIKDIDSIKSMVRLSPDELKGLELAMKNKIPFQITPYYLSLFDRENSGRYDHAIRAQVLPGENYCLNYIQSKNSGTDLDFMDEKSTSPVRGITRR